jgi:hypothetical protein
MNSCDCFALSNKAFFCKLPEVVGWASGLNAMWLFRSRSVAFQVYDKWYILIVFWNYKKM